MKEIDLYKNLPRVERRKQERMLQKNIMIKPLELKTEKNFKKAKD